MTIPEQQVNQVRLEITMEEIIVKQAMRNGVEFDIKQQRLRINELLKKLNELLEYNKVTR